MKKYNNDLKDQGIFYISYWDTYECSGIGVHIDEEGNYSSKRNANYFDLEKIYFYNPEGNQKEAILENEFSLKLQPDTTYNFDIHLKDRIFRCKDDIILNFLIRLYTFCNKCPQII